MGIRTTLLSVLGEDKYLALLAGSFQRIYRTGWLGVDYQDVYFLKEIVREGDYCVDIGAHLGYYTLELSRLVKGAGKVVAVEPMPKFNATLRRLLQRKKATNVELYQVAMGGEGEYVEMGVPKVGNAKKFAYARVKESAANFEYAESAKVKNEKGNDLFRLLPRLDFIKCDVEGLEVQVFSSMMEVVQKHLPLLLCELGGKQDRIILFEMLQPLGYSVYRLEKGKLHPLDVYSDVDTVSHNHYLIPTRHVERLKTLIVS
jgi:FkbM family methyltransferase